MLMGSVAGTEGHATLKPALLSRLLVSSTCPGLVLCAVPLAKLLPGGAHTGCDLPLQPEQPPSGGGGLFPLHGHLPAAASLPLLPANPTDPLPPLCRSEEKDGRRETTSGDERGPVPLGEHCVPGGRGRGWESGITTSGTNPICTTT